MRKDAPTEFPVHELVRQRWSTHAFDTGRSVDPKSLASLLEAARWAPSSYNEQPWIYIAARREDAPDFARILGCLVPGNQAWAKDAAVLMIGCARQTFTRNGNPNRHAAHDLGAASAWMTVQAESLGLKVHQMAGIDVEKCRAELKLPEGCEPMSGVAIGFPTTPDKLPADLQAREKAPRSRKPMAEIVFKGVFGTRLG